MQLQVLSFLAAFATVSGILAEDVSRCPSSPYRRPDGSCNNVRHPKWGSTNQPYSRISHQSKNGTVWEGSGGVIEALERTFNPSHHAHLTALLGLWSDLIYKDISKPILTKSGKTVNGATAFLDGSDLYGTEHHLPIRDDRGGIDIKACTRCSSGSGTGGLYRILYEEHNRLVEGLSKLNPYWPGDMLFEEAKRIVVAQVQHITYNEYLPVVLGEVSWSKIPQARGFHRSYSSSIKAGTVYETAMTVLHFLPTMIPPPLASMGLEKNASGGESMTMDMISTSLTTPAQVPNLHFNTLDEYLSAVQLLDESRKKGIASYSDASALCANLTLNDFSDPVYVSPENRHLLASIYNKADEIDLLIGGVLENLRQGSLVGPTFNCLLSQQFTLLRDSDRFWYENDLPPSSFTKAQLTEIRKVTLSGLLCENMRSLRSIQPKAFFQEDPFLNAAIICDHHSMFDLEPWKDSSEKDELDPEQIKDAIRRAEEDLARRQRREFVTYSNVGGVDPKSPVGTAAAFSKPNKMALLMANNSLLYEYATQELMDTVKAKQARRRRQLEGDNVIGFVPDIPVKDFLSDLDIAGFFQPARHLEPECHEDGGPCDPRTPYRTYTGHCNNLDRPNLGRSLTTFARLLPSVYENGVSSPRTNGITGLMLPSARLVSSMIHVDISHLHSRYSLMLMQFAQFVDHDITFTPNHRGFFASIPDCRSCDSALTVHPECMPIHIPPGDPFYPQLNISTGERMCLPFMRSLPGQQKLGSREQINQNSAYLDGSQIYGEHTCLGRELRGYGGRLNVTIHPTRGKELMPISPTHPECKAPSGYCFIAGDGRASEQPGLTAIHTVYLREHNRIADSLRIVNPHWSDEKVYQTSRRIVIASYQHVIYNEFLPRLLGWNAINLYGLKLNNHGYYKGIQQRYLGSCNPNIVTEFATAAYRIGHSLLRPHIPRMSPAYTPVDPPILLRDAFFNPDVIYQPHIIDEIMRGLVSTPMENLDQFITGEISNHLFEDRRIPHSGMDLPALNIQRGRDHGIPPYNEYRSLCNLKRASTWDDLSREIPQEVIARLRVIYANVEDIDLFPGGLSERPLQGGLVGPTFACIIGLQFRQLRKCDRFWYESGDPLVRFAEPQLAEIRKTTLSKIICDNLDVQSDMQRSAFDQASDFLNPRLPCHSLPTIDLNLWREGIKPGCQIAGRNVPIGESSLPTPCTSCICTAEGAQCASLRVTDCGRLVREAGREAVLRDDVCSAQCTGIILGEGPPLQVIEEVVSLTTRRPRHRVRPFDTPALLPPPLRPRRPPSRKFSLPDIATFLG